MRTPRPWYRKQNNTWYVCQQGKQIPLCKGKDNNAEAQRLFFRLMAHEANELPEPTSVQVCQIADLFLYPATSTMSCQANGSINIGDQSS